MNCAVALAEPGIVREERIVEVDGVKESWRLVWIGTPRTLCGAFEPDMTNTCPCNGFAYGEEGHLVLERLMGKVPTDSLDLDPLFDKEAYYTGFSAAMSGVGALRRWDQMDSDPQTCPDDDPECKAFVREVKRRPLADVMKLGDYDHDGHASEFLIQVGNMPCGKRVLALVGISRNDHKLHYFRTAAHPERPLTLKSWEWEALLASHGPVEVADWECGDHGAEVATKLVLSATNGDIRVHSKTLACTDTGEGNVIEERDE